MLRPAWKLALLLCVSCAPPALAPREAVPIKSACAATSRPAVSVALDVRQGRRHSEARTIAITNVGDRPRAVSVQQVARAEGACSGEWARQTQLAYRDAATGEAPAASTLVPGQRIELVIGPQRVAGTWPCTKVGLALWLEVDDEAVCADAGAWIAEGGGEQ
jgi:hypothetical protein